MTEDKNKAWALRGGPDNETMRRLVVDEQCSDTDMAERYGVTRQTARYWRLRAGIEQPAPQRNARRDRRYSHKGVVWWSVRRKHANHPVRRRLIDYSLTKQGAEIAYDAAGRLEEFIELLERENKVVAYDQALPDPFYYVLRDPAIDAPDDIVRRH